eukprot:SAG22_NODE_21958_length_252_cov_1.261438_1_plen_61_part_10
MPQVDRDDAAPGDTQAHYTTDNTRGNTYDFTRIHMCSTLVFSWFCARKQKVLGDGGLNVQC